MTSQTRMGLWLLACSIAAPLAFGQEPGAKYKAKFEFRWLENYYIKDVTGERGIQTSCGGRDSYLHKKPILTGNDIAKVSVRKFDSNGLGVLYAVSLELTKDARQKLAMEIGKGREKWLAIVVGGRYRGADIVAESTLEKLNVVFFSDKSEAEEIVNAFK